MKTKAILLTLLIAIFTPNYAQDIQEKLLGKWENEKYDITYEFHKDYVHFTQGGFPVRASYTLDEEKTPIWVDFTITQGPQSLTMPGLLEIVNDTTIAIEQFSPRSTHPTEFSPETDGIIKKHTLKRLGNSNSR